MITYFEYGSDPFNSFAYQIENNFIYFKLKANITIPVYFVQMAAFHFHVSSCCSVFAVNLLGR